MPKAQIKQKIPIISGMYEHFLNNESGLKRYLKRFFYRDEDIEDMAQETFLKAYKYGDKREIEYPKAYLYQVAKSVALRELSRKSRQLTDYMEEAILPEPEDCSSVEDELVARQKLAHFCESIAELPPQCRRVFLMRKYQAMSHREIAQALDISVSAVEQQITLGLKRCKAGMAKKEVGVNSRQSPSHSDGRKQS